uniref:ADP-ribosylation factor-like protein 5B n=1 Tax=Caenorhabditis tropicalis TaxID=1561998 RepID=A0A1I7UHM9_9PELO
MGLIMAKLFRSWWEGKKYKIIVVGLDNAGKTTILYNYVTKDQVETKPTIGSNVEEVSYRNLDFVIWDIGGQESLRKSWSTYYIQTDVVIVVIDSSDSTRLPVMKEQLHNMLQHEDLTRAHVLVLANKQDLPEAMNPAEVSTQLGLQTLRGRKWQINGCCAVKGEGLPEALEWIANNL